MKKGRRTAQSIAINTLIRKNYSITRADENRRFSNRFCAAESTAAAALLLPVIERPFSAFLLSLIHQLLCPDAHCHLNKAVLVRVDFSSNALVQS